MRRAIPLLVLAMLAVMAAAPSAAAKPPPQHFRLDNSFSVQDDVLTQACGTPVYFEASGEIDVKLFFNNDGLVVREIDQYPAFTVGYFSPETGNSIVSPQPSMFMNDYEPGAPLGSTVQISNNGLYFRVGKLKITGHALGEGVVVDYILPEGIPFFEWTNIFFESVPSPTYEELVAAECAILNPN